MGPRFLPQLPSAEDFLFRLSRPQKLNSPSRLGLLPSEFPPIGSSVTGRQRAAPSCLSFASTPTRGLKQSRPSHPAPVYSVILTKRSGGNPPLNSSRSHSGCCLEERLAQREDC